MAKGFIILCHNLITMPPAKEFSSKKYVLASRSCLSSVKHCPYFQFLEQMIMTWWKVQMTQWISQTSQINNFNKYSSCVSLTIVYKADQEMYGSFSESSLTYIDSEIFKESVANDRSIIIWSFKARLTINNLWRR